jgi:predicted Fe-S protein YdhL (DUF1289 family)
MGGTCSMPGEDERFILVENPHEKILCGGCKRKLEDNIKWISVKMEVRK